MSVRPSVCVMFLFSHNFISPKMFICLPLWRTNVYVVSCFLYFATIFAYTTADEITQTPKFSDIFSCMPFDLSLQDMAYVNCITSDIWGTIFFFGGGA